MDQDEQLISVGAALSASQNAYKLNVSLLKTL
jgi:hypothetical protein